MDSLQASCPEGDLLPISIGRVSLRKANVGSKTLILPFRGQDAGVSRKLHASIGMSLPQANRSNRRDDARLLWFGRENYMLTCVQACDLSELAAVTDQSDAWASIEISGKGLESVLARLVPVDLRPSVFGTDATVRTLVGHMSASLTRTGADSILIMVFRSMAETLIEELKEAMEAVDARG